MFKKNLREEDSGINNDLIAALPLKCDLLGIERLKRQQAAETHF